METKLDFFAFVFGHGTGVVLPISHCQNMRIKYNSRAEVWLQEAGLLQWKRKERSDGLRAAIHRSTNTGQAQ